MSLCSTRLNGFAVREQVYVFFTLVKNKALPPIKPFIASSNYHVELIKIYLTFYKEKIFLFRAKYGVDVLNE